MAEKGVAERVVEHWRRTGISLKSGASAATLADLASLLGRDLPADVRDFYALANGMSDGETDEDVVRFWSIAKMREEQQGGQWGDSKLGFADVLIDSWRFVLQANDSGVIVLSENVFAGAPMELVGNFTEFLELYLARSPRLRIRK